jgi:hypothetical protein
MTIRLGGEESGVYPVSAGHRVVSRDARALDTPGRLGARLMGSARLTRIRRARWSMVKSSQDMV